MAILKSEEGLIQLDRCPVCNYSIMQGDMAYANEQPAICRFCAAEERAKYTPVGIMPERIWKYRRITGLRDAIARYIGIGDYGEVVREWCRELYELLRERNEEDA